MSLDYVYNNNVESRKISKIRRRPVSLNAINTLIRAEIFERYIENVSNLDT